MDILLLPFLKASDETEREQYLVELLQVHAGPVIRSILRQRLNFYVNAEGLNPRYPDAEDLYQEILAKILTTLQELAKTKGKTEIVSFKQYVARIAINNCHDYLRINSPMRARFKKVLRDLLTRHKSFAIWQSESETLCGFSVWLEGSKSVLAQRRLTALVEQEGVPRRTVIAGRNLANLSEVVADIFERVGGPVELDSFVSILGELLGIKERHLVSLDSEAGYNLEARAASKTRAVYPFDVKETLATLWAEILQLPSTQRDTICFGFADSDGKDLFTLLLEAEIVTFPALAGQLGRSPEEISRLWAEMPLDTMALADLLGVTSAQIYKWRFLALNKLRQVLHSKNSSRKMEFSAQTGVY